MYSILSLITFNTLVLMLSFIFYKIKNFDFLKTLIMTILISTFFGFRPLDVGADTIVYYTRFVSLYNDFEVGFTFLNRLILIIFGIDRRIYFTSINFIVILNLLISFRIIVKDPVYIFSSWILISLPYSILMQINIIRQGLGLSFFILGLSLILDKRKLFGILFFLVSITIHSSLILYIISFSLTFFVHLKKNTKILLLLLFSFVSIIGLPFELIRLLDIYYLNSRIFIDLPVSNLNDNFSFLIKISFYLLFYLVIDNFMIGKNLVFQIKLSSLYFVILISGISILHNELYSVRYLLGLDFLLAPFLLLKGSLYKNKEYLFIIFIGIFVVFILSVFSNSFNFNFGF